MSAQKLVKLSPNIIVAEKSQCLYLESLHFKESLLGEYNKYLYVETYYCFIRR